MSTITRLHESENYAEVKGTDCQQKPKGNRFFVFMFLFPTSAPVNQTEITLESWYDEVGSM